VESLYLDNFYSAFDREAQRALFTFADEEAPYRSFRHYWDEASSRPELARMLYADQKTYLVELLMKQDQMSMAASLESRVPFLDHTFVEFATRVPDSLKIRGTEGKYIVKKAVEDILPHDIIYRSKMGFTTPLSNWLKSDRAEPLLKRLTAKNTLAAPFLRMPAIEALLERHRRGAEDCTDRIWRLLNLVLWGDIFFTGKREEVFDGLMGARKGR
jgi:asparagine synthase (glutamine-hydrolysing)